MKSKQSVVLRSAELHSFLTATFTFKTSKAKVGDQCLSQLVAYSNAISSATSVTMSKVKIFFEGNIKSITLRHVNSQGGSSQNVAKISLRKVVLNYENENSHFEMTGDTFLTFQPGSVTVFELSSYLGEPGNIKAISASFYLSTDLLDLEYIHSFSGTSISELWWYEGRTRKSLIRKNVSSLEVLPKPLKLDLQIKQQNKTFCVNEIISLQLSILNKEDLDSVVALDAQMLGDQAPQIRLENCSSNSYETCSNEENSDETSLTGMLIGKIAVGKMATVDIVVSPIDLPAKYELVIKATYHLDSDTKTIMSKTVSVDIQVVNPFEVTYDLSPRVHPEPWPSLFAHGENIGEDVHELQAQGIAQRWCLTASCKLIEINDVSIEDVRLEALPTADGIQCLITKWTDIPNIDVGTLSNTVGEYKFDINTRSFSLDKQLTLVLDSFLIISWRRRTDNSTINHTKLHNPRLLASACEPRAIAKVSYCDGTPYFVHFDIMIENPSFHLLSFALKMESGENFAFSGPKKSILQLLPLSRKNVRFKILPRVRDEWIGPIHCLIRDRYFHKVLKIMPTEGMKLDKDRIMIWIS